MNKSMSHRSQPIITVEQMGCFMSWQFQVKQVGPKLALPISLTLWTVSITVFPRHPLSTWLPYSESNTNSLQPQQPFVMQTSTP